MKAPIHLPKKILASALSATVILMPGQVFAEGAALSANAPARNMGTPYASVSLTIPKVSLNSSNLGLGLSWKAPLASALPSGSVYGPGATSIITAQSALAAQNQAVQAAAYAPAAIQAVQAPVTEAQTFKPARQALKALSKNEAVAPLAQNGAQVGTMQGLSLSRAFFDLGDLRQAGRTVSAGSVFAPRTAVLSRTSTRAPASSDSAVERLPQSTSRPGFLKRFFFALAFLALSAVFLTPGIAPSGIIHQGRNIEVRGTVSLNGKTITEIQQSMILQDIAMQREDTALKFFLGSSDFDDARFQDQAALADTMLMISRPVDVIIKTEIGPDSLRTLLSATGKRLMFEGARVQMGPVMNERARGKDKDVQIRRNLFNGYVRGLESLIMLRAGVKDRVHVNRDLHSAKTYNSMEALYYGQYGLIDGILVDQENVITREDMDQYFKANKTGTEAIAEFLKYYSNISKLPRRPLRDFSPRSVTSRDYSLYTSPVPIDNNVIKGIAAVYGGPIGQVVLGQDAITQALARFNPAFYANGAKLNELPVQSRIASGPPANSTVTQVSKDLNGILYNDTIFFSDEFRDASAENVAKALIKLDAKKNQEKSTSKNTSNIRIYLNSPGGGVTSVQELRSTILSLDHKVDVIIHGMGLSGGSWLLSSATGKRFATPQAVIMFHQAGFSLPSMASNPSNEEHDMLDQATEDYIDIIARASGKDRKEVEKDFDRDYWLNPVEALMYGKKGVIDAILVGHNKIITRENVYAYLLAKLKTRAAVDQYLERKWEGKRDPKIKAREWQPEKHNEDDPFDNPEKTIQAVAALWARPISAVPGFERSAPVALPTRMIEFYSIVPSTQQLIIRIN